MRSTTSFWNRCHSASARKRSTTTPSRGKRGARLWMSASCALENMRWSICVLDTTSSSTYVSATQSPGSNPCHGSVMASGDRMQGGYNDSTCTRNCCVALLTPPPPPPPPPPPLTPPPPPSRPMAFNTACRCLPSATSFASSSRPYSSTNVMGSAATAGARYLVPLASRMPSSPPASPASPSPAPPPPPPAARTARSAAASVEAAVLPRPTKRPIAATRSPPPSPPPLRDDGRGAPLLPSSVSLNGSGATTATAPARLRMLWWYVNSCRMLASSSCSVFIRRSTSASASDALNTCTMPFVSTMNSRGMSPCLISVVCLRHWRYLAAQHNFSRSGSVQESNAPVRASTSRRRSRSVMKASSRPRRKKAVRGSMSSSTVGDLTMTVSVRASPNSSDRWPKWSPVLYVSTLISVPPPPPPPTPPSSPPAAAAAGLLPGDTPSPRLPSTLTFTVHSPDSSTYR